MSSDWLRQTGEWLTHLGSGLALATYGPISHAQISPSHVQLWVTGKRIKIINSNIETLKDRAKHGSTASTSKEGNGPAVMLMSEVPCDRRDLGCGVIDQQPWDSQNGHLALSVLSECCSWLPLAFYITRIITHHHRPQISNIASPSKSGRDGVSKWFIHGNSIIRVSNESQHGSSKIAIAWCSFEDYLTGSINNLVLLTSLSLMRSNESSVDPRVGISNNDGSVHLYNISLINITGRTHPDKESNTTRQQDMRDRIDLSMLLNKLEKLLHYVEELELEVQDFLRTLGLTILFTLPQLHTLKLVHVHTILNMALLIFGAGGGPTIGAGQHRMDLTAHKSTLGHANLRDSDYLVKWTWHCKSSHHATTSPLPLFSVAWNDDARQGIDYLYLTNYLYLTLEAYQKLEKWSHVAYFICLVEQAVQVRSLSKPVLLNMLF
ncbi:hypothetical protein BDZ97DRAFT_1754965 [Flammula alnicola]|nr:hypothetical protein BDZ97DRAFT_1754965 [Flammula alnicola]